jgi:hypothetical protein
MNLVLLEGRCTKSEARSLNAEVVRWKKFELLCA